MFVSSRPNFVDTETANVSWYSYHRILGIMPDDVGKKTWDDPCSLNLLRTIFFIPTQTAQYGTVGVYFHRLGLGLKINSDSPYCRAYMLVPNSSPFQFRYWTPFFFHYRNWNVFVPKSSPFVFSPPDRVLRAFCVQESSTSSGYLFWG